MIYRILGTIIGAILGYLAFAFLVGTVDPFYALNNESPYLKDGTSDMLNFMGRFFWLVFVAIGTWGGWECGRLIEKYLHRMQQKSKDE